MDLNVLRSSADSRKFQVYFMYLIFCKKILIYTIWYYDQILIWGDNCGVVVKVLDYNLEVSEFELGSLYYVNFRTYK